MGDQPSPSPRRAAPGSPRFMQSTASAATRTAGKTNTFAGEGAGPATNAAAREAMREAVQLRSQMRQQRIRERVEEASTNEAAYQDPAELLAIHMCTPAELTPQACVARMVYFTIKSEDVGRVGSGSEVTYVSSTEGMTTGAASAASAMEAALDYGVLAGGSMVMLEQVIHEVYVPLVHAAAQASMKAIAKDLEATADTMEFVSNIQKFAGQLVHAIQQMTGDVRLTIPAITIDEEAVDAAAADTGIINQLETALEDWTPNIAMALEAQLQKQPVGKGPLAEIEHWRARAAALSTLYEQLNTPNARRMINVLEKAESSLLSGFNYQFAELEKRDRKSVV